MTIAGRLLGKYRGRGTVGVGVGGYATPLSNTRTRSE
jgi:hypothetical protein